MKVTFCGHSQLSQGVELEKWLFNVTCCLIEKGADTFYLGGYGEFDRMAASVLCRQKKLHPSIQRILVLAYLNTRQDVTCYDDTIFPPLETVPRRFAIPRRNRWMVEASDVVVGLCIARLGRRSCNAAICQAKRKTDYLICRREEVLTSTAAKYESALFRGG